MSKLLEIHSAPIDVSRENQLSSPVCTTLAFCKNGDRFTHVMAIDEKSSASLKRSTFLQSITTDAQLAWPSDPPLQQVVLEPLGPDLQHVALGVGLSGHGHWSLAARCLEDNHSLELDFACRISRPAMFLGSTYRILDANSPDHDLTDAPPNKNLNGISNIYWHEAHIDGNSWTGTWTQPEKAPLKIQLEVTLGKLLWSPELRQLQILPLGSLDNPATLRWCYRFRQLP